MRFQVKNIHFLLVFGISISFRLTEVVCLYENANLTEVVENLELAINEALAYDAPSDFTSYVKTTSSNITGKFYSLEIGAFFIIVNFYTNINLP